MDSQPIFIQVGDLADGFAPDSHILPAVGDFAEDDVETFKKMLRAVISVP